ncbi:MAG: CCA tRNA nucleotidyltransferase [Candidatus Micrarchaeota archaeon]
MGEKECEKVFAAASRRITPSAAELKAEKRFASQASKRLASRLPKDAEVNFVGSAARDTGIAGDRDIDLFISFSKERSRDEIVELTRRAALAVHPDWEMHYAEHPYLQAVVRGFKVEVIPCYRIVENEALASAVDRTPLHALYLQKHLSSRQKRDVRLLKQLLKSHGIYGAEAEVEGFSGLVCEYLVLNYRSLHGLLQSAAKWVPPVILDIEGAYDGEEDALRAKFQHHLVLVDFVDCNRNAAAAISETNFSRLILLAREFLARPSLQLLFPKRLPCSSALLSKTLVRRMHMVVMVMPSPKGIVSDILVPQLRHTQRSLERHLALEGFRVFGSHSFCTGSECALVFELESASAPKLKRRAGPPVTLEKDVSKFLASHGRVLRGPYVEGGRVFVEEASGGSAESFLAGARARGRSLGVASHFLKPFSKARILSGGSILKAAGRNKGLSEGLCAYVLRAEGFLRR